MRRFLFAAAAVAILTMGAQAQDVPSLNHKQAWDGIGEGGWVVQFPTGSSDYFNVRYDLAGPKFPADLNAVTIAVADFGAASTYPVAGAYNANLTLDPSGDTPNLGSPIATVTSPPALGLGIGNPTDFKFPGTVAGVSGLVHAVVQLPPGDNGFLGIYGDSNTSAKGGHGNGGLPNVNDSSGFTLNGYSTPANNFSLTEFGIGLGFEAKDVGTLKLVVATDAAAGDFDTVTTQAGDQFGLYFGRKSAVNVLWWPWVSFLGAPLIPIGNPIPTVTDPAKPGFRYLRINNPWPAGAGGLTVNLVALSAQIGVQGSIKTSQEVTIISLPDPSVNWGVWDDGTIESGWVVQFPTLSSDYFSIPYGAPGVAVNVTTMAVSVLDFGGTTNTFPRLGLAPPNLTLDGSGFTPNLGATYIDGPFTFPPLTFATTSGQYVTAPRVKTIGAADNTVGFIQLPPGDPGFIGVGGDTNATFLAPGMGWTLDGYTTPANIWALGNWGIRAQ